MLLRSWGGRRYPLSQRLKILLDENLGIKVYEELKRKGFDVQSILLEHRGMEDTEIIETAKDYGKVIVTMDKDFGYLAISQDPPGLVLLRLRDPRVPNRLKTLLRALELREKLYGYITVVTEVIIRRRPINP